MGQTERSVGILGLGTYVPERIMTNFDLEKMVDTSDTWIVERTGIRQRHIAAPEQATSDLAAIAAQNALADAGVDAAEIDLVILATATPDMLFPSTACIVQDKIGATNAAAFDLSAGCTGFMYALITGTQFIKAGLYRRVLVIGAEALSKILNWEDRNTCVLFGDGAGAAVLGEVASGSGLLGSFMGADGSGGPSLCLPAGGSRMPATHETVDNRKHCVHMDGSDVFKFAVRAMGDAAAVAALEKAGLGADELDWLIPHQANIRIIQSAAKRIKMPMDKVVVNVDKYGNTSSASIPIALKEAVVAGQVKKGDIVLMVGFGAGLTWGSCILKWSKEDNSIAQ